MNLYLLERLTDDPIYDCNDGHVIVARSPQDARKQASGRMGDEGSETWLSARTSSLKLLAKDVKLKRGIVLTDFHAG